MTTEIESSKEIISHVLDSVIDALITTHENKKEPNEEEPPEEKEKEKDEETGVWDDISGKEVESLYESCPTKKWIKLVPLDKTIPMESYNRKEHFIKVADIVLDDEIVMSGKKEGKKKRNTLIQFLPSISLDEFNKKTEWLYLLLINDRIVKIGGTRVGLKGRVMSYMCGHHIAERGKSGDCSKTNGFIYNTFEFYLKLGCTIQMYGYELPRTEIEIKIFDKMTKIVTQTYHAYESTFLDDYKKRYEEYPILCDNCDPDYKDKEE
jgi:hypothetical protein